MDFMLNLFRKNKGTIWLFFFCSITVFIIEFTILQSIIQYRLFNITQDWPFIILYRGLRPNPISQLVNIWTGFGGLHITAQIYHIGILSDWLGFNYQSYQLVNVTLKAIATISVFPLVLILFKKKLLAFLATILFGINSTTTGSFLWVVKGSEFLAVATMNLFFISYYYMIIRHLKLLVLLSSFLFLTTYLLAPPRLFPLFILVVAIEIYLLLKKHKFKQISDSIIRMLIIFLPSILVSLPAPVSTCCPFASRPPILLGEILRGNWPNLLDPFAGIGWSLLTNDYWKFFGSLDQNTFQKFGDYLLFIIKGPLLILGILTIILSIGLSKRPWYFFKLVFGINLMLEILMFFIANRYYNLPVDVTMSYSIGQFLLTKYPTLVAFYIFVVAFACFLEWRKYDKKNNLLMALWIGPVFALIFHWQTWLIMGFLVNDWSSTHWYFMIPSLGISLFLASILSLIHEKSGTSNVLRGITMMVILGIVSIFYYSNKIAIDRQFFAVNPEKISIKDQQLLHEKLFSKLGPSARKESLLLYFDFKGDDINLRLTNQYYKEALVVTEIGDWIHFRTGRDAHGCIAAITDKNTLKAAVQRIENKTGFIYEGQCISKNAMGFMPANLGNIFYDINSLYAFRVRDGEFIDIRDETLKELGLSF